ncbi:MAG: AbrB/MazE/SpoVT family DNA-binding domain-containing protein [Fimbriimonadaceae bacterium]|nr:AbrB/MazE/SpoVT family DNA-binding domain-containing protein [Fimbriimonadaceae bacterium]
MGTNFPIEECFFGTVRVGERGQVVIPHEARQALGIMAGDQVMMVRDPKMKGLMLVKVDELQEVISHLTMIMERAKATPIVEVQE